ncbi:Presequence protease, mitochondrial [Eumeta japonica]|uniref:Presequence protease, mitochondrial n=2 Tax=Ditrysia TaxID=37567 RepID=A0A4C1ZL26_EUMVA|nr:Presequence protease, mitochondrial [Eumeta japonica]
MAAFTNEEYADIIMAYGRADGNAREARRIYEERFPNKRLPSRNIFQNTYQRLRETGNVQNNETRGIVALKNSLKYDTRRSCHGNILKQKNVSKPQIMSVGSVSHGFLCTDVEDIKEYNMTAYLLKHEKTKTEYLHLERDDSNNVFSIGFRTTPLDSMGTPHILEHTVLCGSEKYPVRDPFFKMLNRSLATFMNALTGPDYTFYPFSSQNEKDYRNLQKVYADAVFKPNLHRLDFLQEGWRLEHSKLEDPNSELVFKGVVYNEMKGAFSETSSLFGQRFLNNILPQGTYGYVSGGDPLCIPSLTYEHLKNFHKQFYHPSNARVYSYGNFPLEANLKFLNEKYLSHYEYLDPSKTIVKPQERWTNPKKQDVTCRVDQFGAPIDKQNQIAIGYVMSDVTDISETLLLTTLSELLLIGPNAAFYKSLIEKNISGGYNSLTGYDNQIRDTLFVVGLRDIERSKFEMVEKLTDETIKKVYEKGLDKDHVESVLNGFELSIKHQSPKFGLKVLFNLMPLWNHNGKVIKVLKVNDLIAELKESITNPKHVRDTIERYFINNTHRLIMTMTPDPKFDENFTASELKLLKDKTASLSKEQKEQIYTDGIELSKAQKKKESLETLPCLKIEEIILNKTSPSLKHTVSNIVPLQLCQTNTNGVTYFKGVLGTDSLNNEQRQMIPFFNYVLDKFDTSSHNYRDFHKHVSKIMSGLGVVTHITEHIDQPGQYEQGILISSHCLDANVHKMMDVWREIFDGPDFSNKERFTMLLHNYCSSLTSGVIDNGHSYAMQAARSLVSSVDACKEKLVGIHHVIEMQKVQKDKDVKVLQKVIDDIAAKILSGSNLRAAFHYSPSNEEVQSAIDNFCEYICRNEEQKEVNRINWTDTQETTKIKRSMHISMNIPVNFCAKAIPVVSYTDPDYPKLRVLSKFLSSKYLHPLVREQNGAYGGGAVLSTDGTFNFYSYRDPNTKVTLDIFDNCANWLADNTYLVDEQNLFESKLAILQQMDQPIAEYMKGVDLFLYGLSYDIWQMQRERVLSVKRDDLLEVCFKYLTEDKWCGKCVIGECATKELHKENEIWDKISGPQHE